MLNILSKIHSRNSAEDKKLIDDLSKTIIKEFMAEYEKLSSLSKETLRTSYKIFNR